MIRYGTLVILITLAVVLVGGKKTIPYFPQDGKSFNAQVYYDDTVAQSYYVKMGLGCDNHL